MRTLLLLAFLSGMPPLIYQVVWTRQVGLLAGGQMGAIAVVLVAFFGGLALGAHRFGAVADRSRAPLRVYGGLEISAGLLAAVSVWALSALARHPQLGAAELLAASAALLLPVTFLLGGTLPALLRATSAQPEAAAGHAGVLVGANTIGAVLGVAIAVASIPALGMRMSLLAAAAGSIAIGVVALTIARANTTVPAPEVRSRDVTWWVLVAAFLVGVATLGFEVLVTRLAMLLLGSSLYAWGLVLALFLVGLAAGNLILARRARESANPAVDLGWLEVAAACSVALGLALSRSDIASSATGISAENLARVAIAVLPASFCMGGAFPLLVRLAVRDPRIGAAFGRLSAANTLGGICGALLAPFALLPALGSVAAGMTFGAVNALVGLAFLASGSVAGPRRRFAGALLCLILASIPVLRPSQPAADPWVLFIAEGRQATAVVTGSWGDRTLIVDGDPEASTAGNARRTEELLAVLPLLLHPAPERFLEVGLGSGITLGTATRFPLERVDCVEIASSVIRAARFFEPDNRGVSTGGAATIIHADARRLLALTPETYDVISANTLHPWSVGATGLYSREYFARMAGALRSGGIAVQWLPTERIGTVSLSLILRTFFDVFPEGGLWWGAGNVIAVGSRDPIPPFHPGRADSRLSAAGLSWQRLGWTAAEDLPSHRIADAAGVRSALEAVDVLVDDRPVLEVHAARSSGADTAAALYAGLVAIAKRSAVGGAMSLWLESLELRAAGDAAAADAREWLANDLGLGIARRARAARTTTQAHRDFREGRHDAAAAGFAAALAIEPDQRLARFGRAGLSLQRGELDAAIRDLERLVEVWPDDARAWSELAGALVRRADPLRALQAAERALDANPYDLRGLANAGLLAVGTGNLARANRMLARIRAISPLGQSPQEASLAAAIANVALPGQRGGRS